MTREQKKLQSCVRLARECNQDYLQTRDRRFLTIRNECMEDARYWKHGAYPSAAK